MKRRPSKRTDWKARCEEVAADLDACEGCLEEANQWIAERKKMLFDAHNQIVKLKEERGTLLDTIFELQIENYALCEDLKKWKHYWYVDFRSAHEEIKKLKSQVIRHFCHNCGSVHTGMECKKDLVGSAVPSPSVL